jgi:hypothetical protein
VHFHGWINDNRPNFIFIHVRSNLCGSAALREILFCSPFVARPANRRSVRRKKKILALRRGGAEKNEWNARSRAESR